MEAGMSRQDGGERRPATGTCSLKPTRPPE
jgi:hypothetical protein